MVGTDKIPGQELSALKKKLLTDLAETIIPATDTPGARESGAVDYMLNLLDQCTDTKTLNRFVEGLQDLEDYTLKEFHRPFSDCRDEEKQECSLTSA